MIIRFKSWICNLFKRKPKLDSYSEGTFVPTYTSINYKGKTSGTFRRVEKGEEMTFTLPDGSKFTLKQK